MRVLILIALFCCLCASETHAQLSKQQKLDSLQQKWEADSARIYRFRKYKFLLAFDNKNSFVRTRQKVSVNVAGLQLGMVYNERHSMGFGFYSVTGSIGGKDAVDEQQHPIRVNLQMSYASIFYEYNFFETKHWEMGVPLELGAGNYRQTVTDSAGKPVPSFTDTLRRPITLFGVGYNITYNIWRWLGIGGMIGYRFVAGDQPRKVNLSGAVYSFDLHIYFGQLYKMAKFGLKRRSYRHNVQKIKNLPD